eukprot:m51a1_g102 hypothetical protein (82) ;mRNA; f:320758-321088
MSADVKSPRGGCTVDVDIGRSPCKCGDMPASVKARLEAEGNHSARSAEELERELASADARHKAELDKKRSAAAASATPKRK